MSKTIRVPPEGMKIINNESEFTILWMLNNNEYCSWSDFKSQIKGATLSKYLNKLIAAGFVEKEEKNKYIITPEGQKKFAEMQASEAQEKILNYPPHIITKSREYEDWILWMLYNNEFCKWADFIDEPLKINQSSLSKSLLNLQGDGHVEKENHEYRITSSGEVEYFNMLKNYDLDRQSILDEESKRIEVITDHVSEFFDEFDITDDGIRYRFLNMVLRLDTTKFEVVLSDEEDFDKILLFFAINHPDNYPNHVTPQEFALKYDIKTTTLKFFIEKIVEDELYAIRFFKLKVNSEITYYIQAEERLEKILNVIIEDYIRKFTYLSKFQKGNKSRSETLDINKLLEEITSNICSHLFYDDLKPSLRIFLVEYIEHLAYKFETEKSLINHQDKIKGLAFQNVFEVIQNFGTSEAASTASKPIDNESYYFLHNRIFDTLEVTYLSKIDFFRMPEFKKEFFPKKSELLSMIEEKMAKGSLSKVSKILTDNLDKLSDIELMILRDMIYTLNGELEDSVEMTKKIIEKYPDRYVGYLFQSITYFLMGRMKDALNIVDAGLNKSFNVLLICQKAQILINYDHDKALETIEDVIEEFPNNFALLRTKFLTVMTDKECCIKNIDAPEELINSLIESYPDDDELKILKGLLYIVTHKYREAKTWIKENMRPDISEHNPRIDIATYLIRAFSYLARGKFDKALKYVRIAEFHYPNHPLTHIMSAMAHGFNLVYNFDPEKADKDLFLEGFDKAISIQQSGKKLSRYYQLKSYILNETDGLEEALKAIDKAIELSPEHFDIYSTKSHLYISHLDKQEFALEFYEELYEKFPNEDKHIRQMKSFSFFARGKVAEGVKILEESLEIYPDSIGMLNNLAIFRSSLGNFDEAKEIIEKAIEIDPDEANLFDTYGEVLMDAGEYEAAIVKFTQALEMSPTAWFAFHTFLKLTKCYKALGMDDKSITCYEKAKELTLKVIPGKRKLYLEQLEESIEDIAKFPF